MSVIVAAARTPFGRLGGALAGFGAVELGAAAIRGALERASLDPGRVEQVIVGQVLQSGIGQAPARQAALAAGIPLRVPAETINKVCASSLRAVVLADQMIRAGDVSVVVTGGMESMSNVPHAVPRARFGVGSGDGSLVDLLIHDGLTWTLDGCHMVEHASSVAAELGISREAQDAWALSSHQRAVRAQDEGLFDDEIVPVNGVAADEGPRRKTSLDSLAALRPVVDPTGSVTAGNAPSVNDGASAVIVTSEEAARDLGLEVLATIVGHGQVAGEVPYIARMPAEAGLRALERAGRSVGDLARVEINEAFASVASHSTQLLGVDPEIVNVNGGAVALGHPIGASGGRLVATLVHELRRNGGGLGLAAICSGGGHGDALLVEVS